MTSNTMALACRFLMVRRQEGLIAASGKALRYLVRVWRGLAPSVLPPASQRPLPPGEAQQATWRYLARHEAFHIRTGRNNLADRKRLLCIGDLWLPQCRKYRVDQLGQLWRDRGHLFDSVDYRNLAQALDLLQTATHLVEYRLPASPETELLRYEARRLGLPILYDIDDPLFSVPAYETYGNMTRLGESRKAGFIRQAPGYLAMMNGADRISVSTPALAAHAGLFTTRPISLRRNVADRETLDYGTAVRRGSKEGGFCLAFASGSEGHEADLQVILGPLTDFLATRQDHRLLIIGKFDRSTLPDAVLRQADFVPFSDYRSYLSALAMADCAVVPLQNDLFNQCKSAVRVLDAMAVSVPVIVSDLADLPSVVRHGQTGMIAGSLHEWSSAFACLAQNRDQTLQMGQAGRKLLEKDWSGASAGSLPPELIHWVETA